MSSEYAEKRIREALAIAKGNQVFARQQVEAWALEDPVLLKALAKNHLSGIVAYHVERVASGRSAKPKRVVPPPPKKKPIDSGDSFGKEILKAVASSSSAIFGLEGGVSSGKRGQASQQHINAIKRLATRNITPPKKR